jgi:hypothetical protein
MAQCEAMSSGRGSDCLRDPFLSDIRSSYARVPNRGQRLIEPMKHLQ